MYTKYVYKTYKLCIQNMSVFVCQSLRNENIFVFFGEIILSKDKKYFKK